MEAWGWVLVAIAVAVVVVAIAWMAYTRMRTKRLRGTFGPEYERTVNRTGDRREAEADLLDRRDRRDAVDVRPLSPAAQERYQEEWRAVQARFVDEPVGAVGDADRLVAAVMRERGYPMEDFDRQADVVSVDHPEVVENYREGHRIHLAYDRGEAGTEDLRQAMVHYRALFERLRDSGDVPSRAGR